MADWVEERISFMDYLKLYVDEPNVKFIPHTAKKGMISVLVNKDVIKKLDCLYVPTENLFRDAHSQYTSRPMHLYN